MSVAVLEPERLLALKFRTPLFEERSNSFVAVLRQVTTNLFPDFIIESPRKFLHFRFELRGWNDLIDEAERERSFCVNHVASVKKLRGFCGPGQLWQKI